MKARTVTVFERRNRDGKWELITAHENVVFHGFGLDVEEDETGFSSYSIAIVELKDGTVITPRADRIQFTGYAV